MSDLPVYVLEREFDAPKQMVWRTWTEPDLLARWYGPNAETTIHELTVEEGGQWLNEMRWGEKANYQRAEFREVSEPDRLVFLQSVTDDKWQITANPMMPDWPKQLLTTVTFEEQGGKTTMRLEWVPHEASEAEIACFRMALEGLDQGWGAGMALLDALLKELQA